MIKGREISRPFVLFERQYILFYMILHIKEAKYLHDYILWIRFNDGAEGEVDLSAELEGEVFEPLKKNQAFRNFKVDPELQTIVWENGTDMAPEFLYEQLRILA
jgi:hypothetical protein